MRLSKSSVIGLSCGLLSAACVGLYVAQVDDEAQAARDESLARFGGEQVEVCVARRDIAAGETIGDADVEMKTWVASLLPADAVSSKSDAVGEQVGSTVLAGEVVSRRRFGAASTTIDVPEGLSAVSVPAYDVQAVGGALAPGARVDVYAVGSSETKKLLSSSLVLETSSSSAGASLSSSSAWATLAVDPKSVEELVAAAQNLELYFALPGSSSAPSTGKESS